MKLLLLADQLRCGGAERHLLALAAGLARRGHQVRLACLKAGGDLDASELAPFCCGSRGGLDLQALARLVALIDRLGPDLLVASSHYTLMHAALARRAPVVFLCHSMGVLERGVAARLRFMVYRRFYRSAACVVFVSALQRQFFAARGILPRRAQVIHNGIDLAHFAPRQCAAGDVPRVGLCAAFREEKRQGDLLAALALLRGQGLPYRALLVGDGPLRAQLEALSARLGLQDSVVLAGAQADVRPWIAMCDVMALTSHSETFPMATLEYMASGKSIVASDVGGLREQLVHGHNGLLYPAGDIAALAGALARLADPLLRARLASAALHTVRTRFGIEPMLERYQALFAALARQP